MINFSPVRISNYPKIDYKKAVKQTPKFLNNLQGDTVSFTGIGSTQKTKQEKVDECRKKAEENIEIFNTVFGSVQEFQKEIGRVKELAEQNKVDGKFSAFPSDEYNFKPLFGGSVLTCKPVNMPMQKDNLEYYYSLILNNQPDNESCVISCKKTDSEGNSDSKTIFYYLKDGKFETIRVVNHQGYGTFDFDENGNFLKYTNMENSEVVKFQ